MRLTVQRHTRSNGVIAAKVFDLDTPERRERGRMPASALVERKECYSEAEFEEYKQSVLAGHVTPDPVLAWVRRTRPDRKTDKVRADFLRPQTLVTDRQGKAIAADDSIDETWVGEYKHAEVGNREYATAFGIALFRRHAGLPTWPIRIHIESAFMQDVCDAYAVPLEVGGVSGPS